MFIFILLRTALTMVLVIARTTCRCKAPKITESSCMAERLLHIDPLYFGRQKIELSIPNKLHIAFYFTISRNSENIIPKTWQKSLENAKDRIVGTV